MKYIRFLKVPKYQDGIIRATITITSDLGETFLEDTTQVAVAICSADNDGDIYLRKSFNWEPHMRALAISMDVSSCDIDWPARVSVTLRNGPATDVFQRHLDACDLPNILSVRSDILDPTQNILETRRTVERRFSLLSGRELCMWEETGESIARHLWDGGIALTAYLDRMIALQSDGLPVLEESIGAATYKRLAILELGCGCGMVGISMAQSIPDCDVVLTDMPEATEIVVRNIDVMNPAIASSASFVALDWEAPLPAKLQNRKFDIVLVSECTYNTDTIPALVDTLVRVIKKSPKAIILLGTKVRHGDEAMFHALMNKARFVKASQARLPLPKTSFTSEPDEEVEVYVFHHEDNPLPFVRRNDKQPVIRFWDDPSP